jgi:hypothetical protein
MSWHLLAWRCFVIPSFISLYMDAFNLVKNQFELLASLTEHFPQCFGLGSDCLNGTKPVHTPACTHPSTHPPTLLPLYISIYPNLVTLIAALHDANLCLYHKFFTLVFTFVCMQIAGAEFLKVRQQSYASRIDRRRAILQSAAFLFSVGIVDSYITRM